MGIISACSNPRRVLVWGLTMTREPCLLCQQPPEIHAEIVRLARTQHYAVIVDWLNDQDIPANWNQVRYFISKHNVPTRLQPRPRVKGYKAQLRIYIGALLEYEDPTFTINNLRLRGPSWSEVTKRLHRDGLTEPMRHYAPIRWRILASKDEFRAWMEKEEQL